MLMVSEVFERLINFQYGLFTTALQHINFSNDVTNIDYHFSTYLIDALRFIRSAG